MSDSTLLMQEYARALAKQAQASALPRATAMQQAQEVIARASACAPEFVDVHPPLATTEATLPAPAEATGKFGRPIIRLKKSRKVQK